MNSTDARLLNRPRPRRGMLVVGGTLVVGVVAWFIAPQLDRLLTGGPALRSLRRDLERSLPHGATRHAAETWFVRHGMHMETNVDKHGRVTGLEGISSDSTWIIPGEIEVYVELDEQQRVKAKRIERVETWP